MTTPPIPAGWYPDPDELRRAPLLGRRRLDRASKPHANPARSRGPRTFRRPAVGALRADAASRHRTRGRASRSGPRARADTRTPAVDRAANHPGAAARACAVRRRHHTDAGRAAGSRTAARHRTAGPGRQPQTRHVVRRRRRRAAAGAGLGRRVRVRQSRGRQRADQRTNDHRSPDDHHRRGDDDIGGGHRHRVAGPDGSGGHRRAAGVHGCRRRAGNHHHRRRRTSSSPRMRRASSSSCVSRCATPAPTRPSSSAPSRS